MYVHVYRLCTCIYAYFYVSLSPSVSGARISRLEPLGSELSVDPFITAVVAIVIIILVIIC